jgi:hypothetical protein
VLAAAFSALLTWNIGSHASPGAGLDSVSIGGSTCGGRAARAGACSGPEGHALGSRAARPAGMAGAPAPAVQRTLQFEVCNGFTNQKISLLTGKCLGWVGCSHDATTAYVEQRVASFYCC